MTTGDRFTLFLGVEWAAGLWVCCWGYSSTIERGNHYVIRYIISFGEILYTADSRYLDFGYLE